MKKYLGKIEQSIKQGLKFLVDKKKALYKNKKTNQFIYYLRLVICVLIIIYAIYVGLRVAIYILWIALIMTVVYFLIPDDILEDTRIAGLAASKPKPEPKKAEAVKKPAAKKKTVAKK